MTTKVEVAPKPLPFVYQFAAGMFLLRGIEKQPLTALQVP
jgi:hypothetical protein